MDDFVETLLDGRLFIADETVQNDSTGRLFELLIRLSNYWQYDMLLAGWVNSGVSSLNG